ncbi:MAG: HAD family hydrolase [Faecousia sp.]
MLTTVLFDLDGTLLPMVQEDFVRAYFARLASFAAPYGYEAKPLVDTLWKGTAAMVQNDGAKTNREVFWDTFASTFGEQVRAHEAAFDKFYVTDFNLAQNACGFVPEAAETVEFLKTNGIRRVLATNPIFPAVATQARIRWAGLHAEDFEFITTYENSRHCKPNPAYFADILEQVGCKAEECLMVGNDAVEDLAAQEVGIPVFLLTPCLINPKERDLGDTSHGDFAELKKELTRRISFKK